jgi:hypothetical protein
VSLDLGCAGDEGKQVLNEQQASPFSLSPTQPPPHGQGHALCPVCPQRQSLPRHRTHRRARASNAAGKSGAQTLKCPWSIIFCIVLSGLPWWSATRSARLAAVNDLAACGTAGRTTIPCEGRCCALRRTRSVAIQKFAPRRSKDPRRSPRPSARQCARPRRRGTPVRVAMSRATIPRSPPLSCQLCADTPGGPGEERESARVGARAPAEHPREYGHMSPVDDLAHCRTAGSRDRAHPAREHPSFVYTHKGHGRVLGV